MNITQALSAPNSSTRLRAALAAGTDPDPEHLVSLMDRCSAETDFFVRDMLTWALTRHPENNTLPLLAAALSDPSPQARSQALHTLSKISHPGTWEMVSTQLLHDAIPSVRTAAWRLAVVVVPDAQRRELAAELVMELGRGDEETQRSLSRALAALEEETIPLLMAVAAHTQATRSFMDDPEGSISAYLHDARRVAALGQWAQT